MATTNDTTYQYNLSGRWFDVESDANLDRFIAAFLARPEFLRDGISTHDEAIAAMARGKALKHGDEWYMEIRQKPAPRPAVEMVRASCGHSVPRLQIMNASSGTACPRCYDRMS